MPGDEITPEFPDFSFFWLSKSYEKAYCIDPPSSVCPFGRSCPNPDVNGKGQQVSIYISSIVYGIVLVYIPRLRRPMLYAHLAVLYSLLIASLVSLTRGALSKLDGIFIVVAVASPASMHLWCLSFQSLWHPRVFPIQETAETDDTHDHRPLEIHAARALSVGALALEVMIICLLFVPGIKGIKFPQPVCDENFGGSRLLYNLAWSVPTLIQVAAIGITSIIGYMVARLMRMGRESESASDSDLEGLPVDIMARHDLISWTEHVLRTQYPTFMSKAIATSIFIIAQLSVFPTGQWFPAHSKDWYTVILLLIAFSISKPPIRPVFSFAIRLSIIIFLIGITLLRLFVLHISPSCADLVLLFLGASAARWAATRFSSSKWTTSLSFFILIWSVLICIAGVWAWMVGDMRMMIPDLIKYISPDGNTRSYYLMEILSIGIWIASWVAVLGYAQKESVTWSRLVTGLTRRAHILKFSCALAVPNILWIQAANNSNSSRPSDMSFGQILSMILSFVTIITLFDEVWGMRRQVWLAVLFSDPMPGDDQPLEETELEVPVSRP
ncbi:hypothetical protein DFP72DRAFT_1013652 [Ephemerocybe angulata]|uniref:Uncharacterized protein n=1 Tax=Ephemerocybe angulata TaxID=980116 RepID=A0A8H6HQR8_9AGAR|nr:hypothetical protein DFP72DRAFT_1013652 [Tulosesus angulatus]